MAECGRTSLKSRRQAASLARASTREWKSVSLSSSSLKRPLKLSPKPLSGMRFPVSISVSKWD